MNFKKCLKKGSKALALITAASLTLGILAGCGSNNAYKDEQGRTVISMDGLPNKVKNWTI